MASKASKRVISDSEKEALVWKMLQKGVPMRKILKTAHCGVLFVKAVRMKHDPEFAKQEMERQRSKMSSPGAQDAAIVHAFGEGKSPAQVVEELQIPHDYVAKVFNFYKSSPDMQSELVEALLQHLKVKCYQIWKEDGRQEERLKQMNSNLPMIVRDVRDIRYPPKKTLAEEFGYDDFSRIMLDQVEWTKRFNQRVKNITSD